MVVKQNIFSFFLVVFGAEIFFEFLLFMKGLPGIVCLLVHFLYYYFEYLFDDFYEDVLFLLLQVGLSVNIVGNSLLLNENYLCPHDLQVELCCIFSRVIIRMVLDFSLTERAL